MMDNTKSLDIVSEFLLVVMENCPAFTEENALLVEQQIRLMYGGTERNYIRKTSTTAMRKKQMAVEEARRTGRVREAAARHGISRGTVYRLLRKQTVNHPCCESKNGRQR